MAENSDQEIGLVTDAEEVLTEEQQQELESQSQPFLGKWNRLISTTNWEKGAIIIEWQDAMAKSDLPKSSYSDDRWSQLCGGATPQHVGRLRRTHTRFAHVYQEYEGLYWSHFYAALDWDDAEMWLEGALQNDWSVSKMRNARWETMGQRPEDKPRVEQIVVSEPEEDEQALDTARISDRDREVAEGPIPEGPDFGDHDQMESKGGSNDDRDELQSAIAENTAVKIRPFESFNDLPDDITAALSSFKIAIIKHKADGWSEISLDDLNGVLDALKALATAASE